MSSASREFLMMREAEENGELYVPTYTKKEVQAKAVSDAQAILDAGEVKVEDAVIDATRVMEYLTTFVGQLKSELNENDFGKEFKVKGAKISFRNSGDRLDYESDLLYSQLSKKLKEREELLKTAFKTKGVIYDEEGVEVQKVPIKTYGKETVVISY